MSGVRFEHMNERQQRDWALGRIYELEADVAELKRDLKAARGRVTVRDAMDEQTRRRVHKVQAWLRDKAEADVAVRASPALASFVIAIWQGRGDPVSLTALGACLPTVGKRAAQRSVQLDVLLKVYACNARRILGQGALINCHGGGYRISKDVMVLMDARFGRGAV